MSNIGGAQGGPVQWQQNPLHQPMPAQNAQPAVAPRDVKASGGMMSGAELVAKMGGAPKADVTVFGKTIKTNSEAYKGALGHLENYQLTVSVLKQDIGQVPQNQIDVLKASLRQVIAEADSYDLKHNNADGKTSRRNVMGELKAMAQTELANLDKVGRLGNTAGRTVTLSDGLALVRGGVKSMDGVNTALNDAAIDPANSKDNFGAGKLNTVSLIAYGNDMRVVKPIVGEKTFAELGQAEQVVGFDPKDLNMGARNIASSNIAAALGCAAMIPPIDLVVHHGQAALAMKLAPGESLVHKHSVSITDQNTIAKLDRGEQVPNLGLPVKGSDGVWKTEAVDYRAIPYNDASKPALSGSIAKGLLDLQAMDCLTGQMDRQPENIFIQVRGNSAQITGIDNDMCMGKGLTGIDTVRVMGDGPARLTPENQRPNYGGPPPLMSKTMYDALQGMDVNAFKALLGNDFQQSEVDAAANRFTELKAHAGNLQTAGRIVDDFQTWRGADSSGNQVGVHAFLMDTDDRSFYKRDVTTQNARAHHTPLDMQRH